MCYKTLPAKKEKLANDHDPPKISFRQAALVNMSIDQNPGCFCYMRDQLYCYYPIYIKIILKLGGVFVFIFYFHPYLGFHDPI